MFRADFEEDGSMFRVETHHKADTLLIRAEGRLSGDNAEHAQSLITRCTGGTRTVIDLTDLTAIDTIGEEILSFFGRLGARFVADNAYSRYLCERLDLPLVSPAVHNDNSGKNARK